MRTRTMFALCALAVLGLIVLPSAEAETIYYDSFSGSGGLSGHTPDTRPGSETWTGSNGPWEADGKANNNAGNGALFLPFTPQSGKEYTLSMDIYGYNAWCNPDRLVGLGFSEGESLVPSQ